MRLRDEKEEAKILAETIFYSKKMILKQGVKHFLINTLDIVYCYSSNKLVHIVDAGGQKYISDKTLSRLETELDPKLFFKINRTHVVNFNFIRSFATHEKNKMKVELKTLQKEQLVLISQTRVNAFKQWIYNQL